MTTASNEAKHVSRPRKAMNQAKCMSHSGGSPRTYSPWRSLMSERQINSFFEQHILAELVPILEGTFQDFSYYDREEAVQDATCQALEAFRVLRLYESSSNGKTALILAKFASSRYLAGVRFAAPRSATIQ